MADLKPGQVYVPGSTAKVARALLDAAKAAGLDPKAAVKTTEGGFIVPEAIAPGHTAPTEPSPAPRRRRSKKNPQKGS